MRKAYLDNVSSTPLRPEVQEAMLPFLNDVFGNPSSLHEWGDGAREGIEEARNQVAQLIGADSEEIIFTASGTESNNMAVKGLAMAQPKKVSILLFQLLSIFLYSTQPGQWKNGVLR